ncbi:MAG TPA: hypothetical protein PLX06_03540 [Fimbriimonadaceae bacterium]|nr:hypothetical protein [Fimbriimonadaceae bacterium]
MRFSSFRLAMAAVGLSAAAVSQAAFADFSLHDPHKVITPGAQSVWFSGRIVVNEDNPGTILWAVHAYLETIGNHALEVGSYAQSYFDWLGAGFGKHAGDVYDGDLFELVVDGTGL